MIKIKKFFETPKKAILSSVCIVAALAVLGGGSVLAANAAAKSSAIGETSAQNYAFVDAGVDPASATILKTKFDFDDGHFVYDIEFVANGYEYDYQVKSSDGTILKRELDPIGAVLTGQGTVQNQTQDLPAQSQAQSSDTQNQTQDSSVQNQTQNSDVQNQTQNQTQNSATESAAATSQQASAQLSLDDAKNAALSDAGLSASDVTYTEDRLDYDDGVSVYEIEFYTSNQSYDYEIDANTGAIRQKSVESFQSAAGTTAGTTSGNQASGSYIDVEEAKSIALNHAGLSSSDVTFSKTKLETDDGYTCYEVEFYYGRTDYDYKIDAVSGTVLEFDAETE